MPEMVAKKKDVGDTCWCNLVEIGFSKSKIHQSLSFFQLNGLMLHPFGKVLRLWHTASELLKRSFHRASGCHQLRDQGMLSLLHDPPHGVHSLHREPQKVPQELDSLRIDFGS